jgi:hypothetical protein
VAENKVYATHAADARGCGTKRLQHQRQHSATVVLRRRVTCEANATHGGDGAERSVVEISETWLGQHGVAAKVRTGGKD